MHANFALTAETLDLYFFELLNAMKHCCVSYRHINSAFCAPGRQSHYSTPIARSRILLAYRKLYYDLCCM